MSTNTSSGEGKVTDKDGGGDIGDGAEQQKRKPLRQPLSPNPPDIKPAEPNQKANSAYALGGDTKTSGPSPISSLSVNAAVFVPRTAKPPAAVDQASTGYDTFDRLTTNRPAILATAKNDSKEISLLKNSMFQLMSDPGSFDELLKKLVDVFNQSVRDEKSLLEVIGIIYELSVEEVNFRYTGARMCDYLSRDMKVKTESGTFRQHLLKRLHQEFQKKDENIKVPTSIPRLHGFTLFVGELFENFKIKIENTGKVERLNVIRKALHDLILTLFEQKSYANFKCAINVLKLTGGILEECEIEETGNHSEMDSIFVKVRELAKDQNVHRDLQENLRKLMTLRESGWDRKSQETSLPTENMNSASAAAAASAQEYSVAPVFFSSDGRQITAQEAGYYYEDYEEYSEEYYGNDEYYGNEYYDWAAAQEGEEYYDGAYILDDEAERDYEQFLRESRRS